MSKPFRAWNFPRGTKVQLSSSLDRISKYAEGMIFEIDTVREDYYGVVVTTRSMDPVFEEPYSFNAEHIERILKIGTGPVVYSRSVTDEPAYDRCFACFEAEGSTSRYKKYYCEHSLVQWLVDKYSSAERQVNVHNLTDYLLSIGVIHYLGDQVYGASVKKLKSAIRQNYNRFLVTAAQVEREFEEHRDHY